MNFLLLEKSLASFRLTTCYSGRSNEQILGKHLKFIVQQFQTTTCQFSLVVYSKRFRMVIDAIGDALIRPKINKIEITHARAQG